MAPKADETKEDPTAVDSTTEKDDDKSSTNDKKSKKQKQSKGNNDDLVLKPDSLSEEDRELKERLETCVETVANVAQEPAVTTHLRLAALQIMVQELRTATSSMTSVPKPLKFLRPHYPLLKVTYEKLAGTIAKSTTTTTEAAATTTPPMALEGEELEFRARLADVLSVLAMTLSSSPTAMMEPRESLKFKLGAVKDHAQMKKGKDDKMQTDDDEDETDEVKKKKKKEEDDNLGSWGHEFVRSLAGEIGQEYNARVVDQGIDPEGGDEPFQDLLDLVQEIVPFHVSHNAEAEAVDLLIEVQRLQYLLNMQDELIDETNAERICLYLVKTAAYMSDPEDFVVRFRVVCVCVCVCVIVLWAFGGGLLLGILEFL